MTNLSGINLNGHELARRVKYRSVFHNIALFSAEDVMMKPDGFSDLIHQPSWFRRKFTWHTYTFNDWIGFILNGVIIPKLSQNDAISYKETNRLIRTYCSIILNSHGVFSVAAPGATLPPPSMGSYRLISNKHAKMADYSRKITRPVVGWLTPSYVGRK